MSQPRKRRKKDVSSDSGSELSDTSSRVSEASDVLAALVDEPVAAVVEHASDVEAEAIVHVSPSDPMDAGLGVVIHPDGIPDAAPAGAGALLDPEPLDVPLFDIGVQRADICKTTKCKCAICGANIDKSSIRFIYQLFKSQIRYIHPLCLKNVPPKHLAHSTAMLRYQKLTVAGADHYKIEEQIDAALASL